MAVQIKPFRAVVPMIYAYQTPGVSYNEGWTKIGYTEKQSVEERIHQQTHTAGIQPKLQWKKSAQYDDGSGEYFTDRDFHDYLVRVKQVPRRAGTEWFQIDGATSKDYIEVFRERSPETPEERSTYELRREQNEAVEKTKAYFESGGEKFLWNAKPRFGKTLSAYDLVARAGFKKVLVVTNRPSIANSWADDFYKFIGWRYKLAFVSDNDALSAHPGVLTREEFEKTSLNYKGFVAFESLQGLKGSVYFGGQYPKLKWMAKEYLENGQRKKGIEFDLLIVDEAHEGVETMKTDAAFDKIARKHTLFLSGTPFRALASGKFSEKQIYNWSYADEQEAKESWPPEREHNPYERLPRLAMFTYQISNMIYEKARKGINLSGEDTAVDYAFDLNEFFATDGNGQFKHKDEVKKFLRALTTQEKYPYSTPKLREELSHTLWLLDRVASAKALAKMLKEDEVFVKYEVVLAAGDGQMDGEDDVEKNDKAYNRVKDAIANHDRTITLSVGQLTVGVTIPEWSGVLMLCNLKSPSSYMQAAFRAQNPCSFTKDEKRFSKETAYVFDFDPARTLVIFDEFANNLSPRGAACGTNEERSENIQRLLNFFPVIGEDEEGKMVELDAAKVLSIPRRLKCAEVVRRGFMSNFLFQNIGSVFGAPSAVTEILKKLTPALEEGKLKNDGAIDRADEVPLNDDGEVEIPREIVIGKTHDLFGPRIYEEVKADIAPLLDRVASPVSEDSAGAKELKARVDTLTVALKDQMKEKVLKPALDNYGAEGRARTRIEKKITGDIDREFDKIKDELDRKTKIADTEQKSKLSEAKTEEEIAKAKGDYHSAITDALGEFTQAVQTLTKNTAETAARQVVAELEKKKAEDKKRSAEDEVRAHLRGFSRTIPSFIMAYGDGDLTLKNFDTYVEEDVFEKVTSITVDDFRFLRDGGERRGEDGTIQSFNGGLFDETVFNDSVEEFWKKKTELANYFDEKKGEDIFDYIPPQKTNQIFTPRWVVQKMVDELEEQNPGCFDDPTKTFADLYMKSGLYITEIVKRLFRSEKMKEKFPDDDERIRHILRNQVYGMAPTRIIYLIATNYILGFNETLKKETKNFVHADAAEASKDGRLAELVERYFG